MLIKTCTLCNKTFEVLKIEDFTKFFFRDKKGKYKHNARCKHCCRDEKIKLYKKFPEKMNYNYVYKRKVKKCIVCDKDFLAREDKHICCSDECKKIKNKARYNLSKDHITNRHKAKVQKEILKAKVRFKHYSDTEKYLIQKYLDKCLTYTEIAKKLGRTTLGVGKVARKLKAKNAK